VHIMAIEWEEAIKPIVEGAGLYRDRWCRRLWRLRREKVGSIASRRKLYRCFWYGERCSL